MIRFLAIIALCLASLDALGDMHTGRVSIGSFLSNESFKNGQARDARNDYMRLSSRLYLHSYELGEKRKNEFTADFRENYDLYGQLDSERRKLEGENKLAFYQAQFKTSQLKKTDILVGRFSVEDTDAHYVDGLQVGYHLNDAFKLSLWGGLNPLEDGVVQTRLRPDAQEGGSYIYYHPYTLWGGNQFYTVNGLAVQQYDSSVDRLYFHHNLVYQWNRSNRIFSLLNLEFVPRTYLQRGNISYFQMIHPKVSIDSSLSAFDVVEYRRIRNVREQLPSAPYQEASLKVNWMVQDGLKLVAQTTHGKRRNDDLERSRFSLGLEFPEWPGPRTSLFVNSGYTDNFLSRDYFISYDLSYYSKRWEIAFTQQYLHEMFPGGKLLNPLRSEISLAHFFHNAVYTTFSYELAVDQEVTISTVLFKLLYRFGNSPVPPVRDGAPLRGKL